MEASRFGFGRDTPPVFKFDPTDADLVASYLLPRALGLRNPHAHAIIEDDPGSVPPWEILARHGHVAAADHVVHAFFFGPPADASHNGGRKSRTVQGGGVWQGQKGTEETLTLLSPDGAAEVDVVYKKYNLTFARTKGGPSSGYVMHEFEILSPPLPGAVLTRIRAKKGAYRPPGADGAHEQQAPFQVPDPSYGYDAVANGEGFAGAQQDGALYDDSNGGGGNYPIPLQYVPACGYGNNYSISIQDQPGTSYNYNGAAMMDNGEGFTGSQLHQSQAFYGAGTVQADGGYYYDPSYVPECGAEFSNYNGHGDYQQWQYQQDPSNHYQQDPSNHCQQDPSNHYQQDPSNHYQQDPSNHCQQDPSNHYQQDPSNHCQQDPSNHYQQDPSNHYQAGDAPVMYAGSEGFMVEQQTGAPCGNKDKDSPVGTDASTLSTISLCGDDEGEAQECDDTTFFNELLGMGDFVKREQNDAGQ